MARFHINPTTQDVSVCKTTTGKCPFGGSDGIENHFENRQAALERVEQIYRELNEEAYKRINKMTTYNAKSMADRAAENIRRLADTYWSNPGDHKRHLKRFIDIIGARCFYCGTENGVYLNDHIVSADQGGITVVGNIGSSCATCNTKKGNMTGEQFFDKQLENPNFQHEVFGRDRKAYMEFLTAYQRPYLKNRLYAEEVKLARRIIAGDTKAIDELTIKAENNFIDWQYSVFPPANGEDYTREERVEFARKWRNGDFKAEKDSAMKRYANSENPIWKRLAQDSAEASDVTRSGYYSSMEQALRTIRDYDYSVNKALDSLNDLMFDKDGKPIKSGAASNMRKAVRIIREVGLSHTKTALKTN